MSAPGRPDAGPGSAPQRSAPGDQLPVVAHDMPVLYEDEGEEEMGESTPHTEADRDLSTALEEHLRGQPGFRVFSNLNVHYHPTNRRAYISPDVMVVRTEQPLPRRLASYRIGPTCPAPLLVVEILSRRSFQQQDLTNKPDVYAQLGVPEYILVDPTGEFLEEKLLLKRRLDEECWADEQDPDGGVTSRLGFRVVMEDDRPRVIHAGTGHRYLWTDEAHRAVRASRKEAEEALLAQQKAEERLRLLEEELKRLKGE